jgi:hypothetical protein
MRRLFHEETFLWIALVATVTAIQSGCGQPAETPEAAPFEAAIAKYLDRGNMAMAVKEIKEGPTVTGDTATLKASLTRSEVGGPSVTWTFNFKKAPDGTWEAVDHEI